MSGAKRRVIGLGAAFLLGAILLLAAWAKLIDPLAFAEQISREGLDFLIPSGGMAILAIGLEIGLGVALVLGIRRRWILWPTGALIVLFLVLTGRAYWLWSNGLLDEEASCGCFGNLVDRTPAEAFWQDLVMLVPLYLASFLGRPTKALLSPRRGALPSPLRRPSAGCCLLGEHRRFRWTIWRLGSSPECAPNRSVPVVRPKPSASVSMCCCQRSPKVRIGWS